MAETAYIALIANKKEGIKTLIDAKDLLLIQGFGLTVVGGYARLRQLGGHRTTVGLHKLLMNPPTGMEVDHINGDRLDNRRKNLRIVTKSQNRMNLKTYKTNTSGHRGVVWNKYVKKWLVCLKHETRNYYLGYFSDKQDAIQAYRDKDKELRGSFSRLANV